VLCFSTIDSFGAGAVETALGLRELPIPIGGRPCLLFYFALEALLIGRRFLMGLCEQAVGELVEYVLIV